MVKDKRALTEVCVIWGLIFCNSFFWHGKIPVLVALPLLALIVIAAMRFGKKPDKSLIYLGMFALNTLIVIVVLAAIFNPDAFMQRKLTKYLYRGSMEYFGWALIQQVILSVTVLLADRAVPKKPWMVAWFTGFFFALVHYPNPTLLIVTLFGGVASARFFLEHRNIYALVMLAIIQAISATMIRHLLPWDWHHNLAILGGF